MFRNTGNGLLSAGLLALACSNGARSFGNATTGGAAGTESGGTAGVPVRGGAAGMESALAGASGSESEAGAAGELVGGQGPIATSPSVDNVDPPEALLGAKVVVRGANFLPAPTVELGPRSGIAVETATDNLLSFVVPNDLELKSCTEPLPLVVINENGSSESVLLMVKRVPPSLVPSSASIAAGTHWRLKGTGLTNASARLGTSALTAVTGDSTSIELNLPRSIPVGNSTLVVGTACGEATMPVQILPPPPAVLSADLTTLIPGAVVMLEVDLSYGATVKQVKVGATTLASDATGFVWATGNGDKRTMAIRIPPGASAGDLDITLEGEAVPAPAFRVKLVTPSLREPPAVAPIILPPDTVKEDFPESTAGPFSLAYPKYSDYQSPWSYDIRVKQSGASCSQAGTITGSERHCPEPVSLDCSARFGATEFQCPSSADACNSFSGTYEIDASSATVSLAIDRGSAEGPEEYVGTWANPDGSPASAYSVYLILRSKRSGRQLVISHKAHRCDP